MKILKLEITNFLTLTQAEIRLDDRGLLLVQGVNEQDSSANSNGAGKSSLVDALAWALYGITAREESGDAVVNARVGKDTRVVVTIEDQGAIYTIARHRKHKQHKNSLVVMADTGSGEQNLTLGTDKLTQEVVDRIVGCSLDVFTGSIYAGQEKMPDLPNMTDKFLKVLIEEAAGITALEQAYTLALSKAKEAKTAYDGANALVIQNNAALTMLESQLVVADQDHMVWEQARTDQIDAMRRWVKFDGQMEHEQLRDQFDKIGVEKVRDEIAEIDRKIAAVRTEQATLARLNAEASQAETARKLIEADARRAIATFQSNEQALVNVRHKIGCPCDTCGRPLTQVEIEVAEKGAEKTRDASRAEALGYKQKLDDAVAASEAAQEAVKTFAGQMTDVTAEAAQRATLEAVLSDARALAMRRDAAKAKLDEVEASIISKGAEVSPYATRIETIRTQIDTARTNLARTEAERDIKARDYDLEQEVARVFSPSGVRARILDDVTPYLNDQTAKYLSVMSDGNITAEWSTLTLSKSGEMKEKFAITVTSGISAKTFKGLSGGEKRKVRIATALALQDLVATRATKPIDLFIGDEIDHALDPTGLERLMTILREKARERGTVLVISHNSLKNEIPATVTIHRDAAGVTTVHESIN